MLRPNDPMPTQPAKPCAHPGCRVLVTGRPRCDAHTSQQRREEDQRRDPTVRRLYNNARWRSASRAYLACNPICARCGGLAEVVDHIVPHRGDYESFWNAGGNWQGLCKRCHDRKTATEDKKMHGGGGAKV